MTRSFSSTGGLTRQLGTRPGSDVASSASLSRVGNFAQAIAKEDRA